jgi:hypothetical protein
VTPLVPPALNLSVIAATAAPSPASNPTKPLVQTSPAPPAARAFTRDRRAITARYLGRIIHDGMSLGR